MKGLYGFLGWSSEETADGTHKACTEMLMLEYLGHGETYRERQKQMQKGREGGRKGEMKEKGEEKTMVNITICPRMIWKIKMIT